MSCRCFRYACIAGLGINAALAVADVVMADHPRWHIALSTSAAWLCFWGWIADPERHSA